MRQLYFFVHRSFFTLTLFVIALLASSQDVTYSWGSAARGVFINKLTPATPSKVKKPHPRGHRSTANVFPVPAREHFTIQLATSSLLNTKAVIADVSGQPVKIISINDYSTLVNMADLPYGTYVLQLADRSSIKIARQP